MKNLKIFENTERILKKGVKLVGLGAMVTCIVGSTGCTEEPSDMSSEEIAYNAYASKMFEEARTKDEKNNEPIKLADGQETHVINVSFENDYLNGVIFRVIDQSTKASKNFELGSKGERYVYVDPGMYTFEVVEVPSGYVCENSKYDIVIDASQLSYRNLVFSIEKINQKVKH